jgi:hypothetical protein
MLTLTGCGIAEEDAAGINALSKKDMISFYEYYVHPSSKHCAKVIINLRSQIATTREPPRASSGSSTGEPSDEDIKTYLREKLKVNEAELDAGVELWREIGRSDDGGEVDEAGIEVDDDGAATRGLLARIDPRPQCPPPHADAAVVSRPKESL